MKTLPANNYQQAERELRALNGDVSRIPKTIKSSDKKHYSVLLVRKINDVARERYITRFDVQCFTTLKFELLTKRYMTLGYSQIIVLHDPTLPVAMGSTPPPPIEETAGAPVETPAPTPPPVAEPFNPKTARVAELREYAEDNNIALEDGDLKADIARKVAEWQEENLTENA